MNKKALKDFSVAARNELINQVTLKANSFGVYRDKNGSINTGADYVTINGTNYPISYKKAYEKLLSEKERRGFDMLMEHVAYTWFNRFIALRFMEVNDYLPSHIRVLSSEIKGKVDPDILDHYSESGLPVNVDEVEGLLRSGQREQAYRKLLIAQCNELSEMMPFLFEKINDYTDMLLPENLLTPDSVISKLVSEIDEEDFTEVETIGWIYQYYISEKKNEVINAKKKYKKEEIPFATQLFTPDWIVRYMVQNALGRYWVESHPEHNDLKKNWEFYLENPNLEPDFEEKLKPYANKGLRVEDIKVLDPACGSGHILVYMFDVLYEIYSRCGYMEREIPRLIIENNLYGLDIDDRAHQLACFSVIMKGMKYNNRLLRNIEKSGINVNIVSIQETNNLTEKDIAYLAGQKKGEDFEKAKNFIEIFFNAKTIGSLIKVNKYDKNFFENRLLEIETNPSENLYEESYAKESRQKVIELIPNILKQAEIMVGTYDVLITNPPYMGSKFMNEDLNKFVSENYNEVKGDIFSSFIMYAFSKVHSHGQLGLMTPFVWMFISTYEKLREMLISRKNISSLVQLEYSGFEEATVPICTFTLRNYYDDNLSGEYIRLSDFPGAQNQPKKTLEAVRDPGCQYRYTSFSNEFSRIPGFPIAYWASEKIKNIFENEKHIKDISNPCIGMRTGDNSRFLRMWYEVRDIKIGYNFENNIDAMNSGFKWFPYNKGGDFRKWYGNQEYVVNWENDGEEIKRETRFKYPQLGENLGWKISNEKFYFKKCITWSFISSSRFGVRYSPQGFIFDVAGSSVFPKESEIFYLIAFLCSKIAFELLKMQNPTMNFQVVNIASLPLIMTKSENIKQRIDDITKANINLSKYDWDSFEVSWDFVVHPLIRYKNELLTIEGTFKHWSDNLENKFNTLKQNEEELNRLFIEIYGLQNEMTPEVSSEDITINLADRERDIKSFISYAVGCMFGRYSLDEKGLIYAGGEFDPSRYKTFKADKDGILPIVVDNYFEDDIVSRLVDFVRITFGEKTLNENLDYIAETLGKKTSETSRDTIRRYFMDEFYSDHCKTYKNRPIYWLVDSGKKKGFRALIYLHRYNRETLATLRLNYLHELQAKYSNEEKQINKYLENDSLSTAEKKRLNKQLQILSQMQDELLEFDKVLDELANKKIELDLDDGVVVNYEKLQPILAKIK